MRIHDQEILFYHDPDMEISRKALAYAKTITTSVKEINYLKDRFTPTVWRQILGMLQLEPKQLMNKSLPYYQENLRGRNFEMDDWINVLTHQPGLLRGPIAIKGNQAVFISSPSHIFRLR